MEWLEEMVHMFVVMRDREQAKKLEAAILELVKAMVDRTRPERYEQGLAGGKRRAVI